MTRPNVTNNDDSVHIRIRGDYDTFRRPGYSEIRRTGEILPTFEGERIITPTFDIQTVECEGYKMPGNVYVLEIPVSSVSNAAGGRTVTIG